MVTEKRRRNTAGLRRGGGRPKGVPNKVSREIRELAGALFDEAYFAQVRERLLRGKLAPAVECKLLAYAYGEPKQAVTLDGHLTTTATVIHEHRSA